MKKNILLSILSIILTLTIALSVTACVWTSATTTTTTSNKGVNDIENPGQTEREPVDYSSTFWIVDALFKSFSIFDIDYETAMLAAIRAYIEATGDRYAVYYTEDELQALMDDNNGDLYGIGVQVIFDYDEHFMEIVSVMPDSPALEFIEPGDKVTHVMINNENVALVDLVAQFKERLQQLYPYYDEELINDEACYEAFQYAVSCLKGPVGTYAQFTVDRNGEIIEMNIQRAKVKTVSVSGKVSSTDSSVGIVSISTFDLTTPVQFQETMDKLIAQGCDKFVFDLRNNSGGALISVSAVLSTLLQKNDVIYSTKDYSGTIEYTKVEPVTYNPASDYASCNVSAKDIAKYSGYEMVVLTNGMTASAAEIFVSALRDYELAEIVGVKTYGKGSVQNVVTLSNYGKEYVGGLRLTTKLFFPPCGIGFNNGIGIEPNHYVELEGIAAEIHYLKLTEDIDNQLQKAISVLVD